MNVLVTGAGGFAGGNIAKYFASHGYQVTGTYRNRKPDEEENCTFIKQELSERIHIRGHFDAIIHTVCARGGDFHTFKRDNVDSMERLIFYARENHIRTIINFSTRSVYGNISQQEVFEESEKTNLDYYGITKYSAECLLRDATDINGINLRLPGISGPGAHDIWLVNTVKRFIANEPIAISDFQTRNFVWIFDIAAFIDKLIRDVQCGKNFRYNTVNLACKEGASNIDIANEIKRCTKSKSEICVIPRDNGLFTLRADKAFEMGFDPHTPMEIVDLYLDTLKLN